MQPWLITLDALERLGSRGWASLQTFLEATDLALSWHPAALREEPNRKF